MEKILLVYLILINIVSVVLTVADKISAKKRGFRISEATLILCGAFGGAISELVTMLIIRHKTRHVKFMLGLPLIILAQIVAIVAFFWLRGGFNA